MSRPTTWKTTLKIPNVYSEAVNLRRIDNTVPTRKRTNNDLQNAKQNIIDYRTVLKTGKSVISIENEYLCPFFSENVFHVYFHYLSIHIILSDEPSNQYHFTDRCRSIKGNRNCIFVIQDK